MKRNDHEPRIEQKVQILITVLLLSFSWIQVVGFFTTADKLTNLTKNEPLHTHNVKALNQVMSYKKNELEEDLTFLKSKRDISRLDISCHYESYCEIS